MKIALIVLALVATAYGQSDNCCSADDIKVVLKLWESVWGAQFTGRRVAIGQAVFTDLFGRVPAAKDLFKNVNADDMNSPEFKAHIIRIINGIDLTLNLLDDPASLDAALTHYANQHAVRQGVRAAHFGEIQTSFLNILPQVIPKFNADVWNACFSKVAAGISSGLPA